MSSETTSPNDLPKITISSKHTNDSEEKYHGSTHKHRCFRCKKFYGRCRCARRMYNHYKNGCLCRMILKTIITVFAIYLLYKLMQTTSMLPTESKYILRPR